MNAYGRSRGIAPVTLNLGTRRVLSGVTPHPGRLTAGNPLPPLNPLNRRYVGPRTGLDVFGEEKNVLSLDGIKPRTVQPVTYTHRTET
jgi:hypothetical protein